MARGGGYYLFKNGAGSKSMRVEDLDTVCENLKILFDKQESTNAGLRKQLEELKAEKWADEKLQEMKSQLDRMQADYWRGFPISEKETKAISKWKKNHDTIEHGNPDSYHGVSGGGYSYEFYPTAIGTAGDCVCGICKRKATEAAFVNGKYDRELYRKYMQEHDGMFEFQELG